MKRGEVWMVNFEPQLGSEIKKERPAVIVEREPFTRLRRTVMVIPLSAAHAQTEFPLLIATQTMGRAGVAVVDQLRDCDKRRFGKRLGRLSDSEMEQISRAVTDLLDLV
jgi:mRNA interferase MazF